MARPALPETIKQKEERIRSLQVELALQTERNGRLVDACWEQVKAGRTLMREALIHIPYHAQTDLRREWVTRWPWLEEAENEHGRHNDDGAGSGPEGRGDPDADADA